MFEKFYYSDWQQPVLLWVCILVTGLLVLRKKDRVSSHYLWISALFLAESAADAGLTSNLAGLTGFTAKALPLLFVVLGDFRIFAVCLLESKRLPKALAFAAVLSLITPLLSQMTLPFWTQAFNLEENSEFLLRALFLNYEIVFLGVFFIFCIVRPRPLGRLQKLTFAYYGLWALADLLILWRNPGNCDGAFLLRLLPNALYYMGLPLALRENFKIHPSHHSPSKV